MAKKTKSIKKDDFITKEYFDKTLDKALKEQSRAIIEAVDFGFKKNKKEFEVFVEAEITDSEERVRAEFRTRMNELSNTLDKFLKHLMDFNDEFKIVKARLARVEKILEEKLGITID